MNTVLKPALVLLVALTALTGFVYPLLVTGIGRVLFAAQAEGSLVRLGGEAVGSRLIGQSFTDPAYFWGRPSATTPQPYNGNASTGSNLGPLNPALVEAVRQRIGALHAADPGNAAPVPIDLVSASGSGLDPEISLAAAYYQAWRVARARGMPAETVRRLIAARQRGAVAGLFGAARVNVLELNLALDELTPGRPARH